MESNNGTIIIIVLVIASAVSLIGVFYPFKPFKKRWVALISFLVCVMLVGVFAATVDDAETTSPDSNTRPSAQSEDNARYWVISERLNRRTCPSTDCGIVGQFFFRESTLILERRDDWARVTEPYNASCDGGRSDYVNSGNAICDPSNGITDGQFAEWVSAEFLSKSRPPDPAADASAAEELVAGSDDFARYRTTFSEAAESLIEQRRCTEQDFREMGGWVKSSNHPDQPIYFTYCGGTTVTNRLYLNAKTGKIFR